MSAFVTASAARVNERIQEHSPTYALPAYRTDALRAWSRAAELFRTLGNDAARATLASVPLGLRAFLDSSGRSAWPELLAMSTLALVPVFTSFLLLQRHLTEGTATIGLKA